ncbi:hypothetical protein ACF0H5_000141 [Mactra antiquata]
MIMAVVYSNDGGLVDVVYDEYGSWDLSTQNRTEYGSWDCRCCLFLMMIVIIIHLSLTVEAHHRLGCYKELPARHFYINPGTSSPDSMTPTVCSTACSNSHYGYAAVRAGRFCLCAESQPPLTMTNDPGGCDTPCSGDPKHTCGSLTHVEVFESPVPLTATLTASKDLIPVSMPSVFNLVVEPATQAFLMKVDYDDNAGETDYTSNVTTMMTKHYHLAGDYDIRGYVTNTAKTLEAYDTATFVSVQRPLTTIALICPTQMVTFEKDYCFLTVNEGTSLMADVIYTDGQETVTKSFPIADAEEAVMGNFVAEHIGGDLERYKSMTETDQLVLHPYYPAEHEGVLVGFEFYAVGLGDIRLQVYRPQCISGYEYCYVSNTCELIGSCGFQCSDLFCSSEHNCCTNKVSRQIALAAPEYDVVYSMNSTIDRYGQWYVYADVPVQPGDIVAHEIINSTSALIASTNSTLEQDYYDFHCTKTVVDTSFKAADCFLTPNQHMFRAIYIRQSGTLIDLEFTKSGNVSIEATVTDKVGSADKVTANIDVFMGVNFTILKGPFHFEAYVNTTFELQPFTGKPANVEWDFGNGILEEARDKNTITVALPQVGVYNLTVNISNTVSNRLNHSLIYAEEYIRNLTVSTQSNVIAIGDTEKIFFNMTSGTNYTCRYKLRFVNGHVEEIDITESDGRELDYVFVIPGRVNIELLCWNNISNVLATRNVMAMERVEGVALSPSGAIAQKDYHIVLTWTSGTELSVRFWYDNISMALQVDETARMATSSNLIEYELGAIPVQYQVWNDLNSVLSAPGALFVIEIPITNPTIECEFTDEIFVPGYPYTVVPLNSGVWCMVNMTNGTSATVEIDWGDGVFWNESASVSEPFDLSIFSFPANHTFTNVNLHHIRVTVKNYYNNYSQDFYAMVMVPVDGLIFDAFNDTVGFNPPATTEFGFTLPNGTMPNMVNMEIAWGDGTTNIYNDIDLLASIIRNYTDRDGDLMVSYTLYNLISSINRTFPLYIVAPIKNMSCYVEPLAGEPGVPLQLVFEAARAPPAGVLDLTFDCDTSDPGSLITRKRLYNSPFGKDIENCTYSVTGRYTMSIRAVSRLEDMTCSHSFDVLNAPTQDFDLFTNAPIDFDLTQDCILNVVFTYHGLPLPDDATIEIYYGDDTLTEIYNFTTTLTLGHTYASDGHYMTTFRIWNDAVEVTRQIWTGCYRNFTYTDFYVYREPLLPVGSPDATGYGPTYDRYRTDENLKIYTSLARTGQPEIGTFVHWEITAESSDTIFSCNNTDKDIVTWMIEEPGTYKLTLTAKNPISAGPSITKTIEMINPSGGIYLTDYGVTNAYDIKRINVAMGHYGTEMCVAVDYGDGSQVTLYGDALTCSDSDVISGQYPGMSTVFDPAVDVTTSFDLEHQYMEKGTYALQLFSFNSLSSENVTYEFAVSNIDCSAPNVDIDNRASNFMYPMTCRRSKRCKIVGRTNIACPETLKNTKRWTAYRWNALTNEQIAEVNIGPSIVPSSINSELSFDPNILPYGLYKLRYTVTMTATSPSGEKFAGVTETFLEIVKSDLVLKISENALSEMSIGHDDILSMCPKVYSYDPDVNTAAGEVDRFSGYSMACRDVTNGEEFPPENVTISIYDAYITPINFTDIGGCFGTGPAWIAPFTGCIRFRTAKMKVDHTYEFLIKGIKDTREAELTVQVAVQPFTPPDVTVTFKIPKLCSQGATGQRFNPKANLGLIGQIANTNPACSYTYFWEVFAYDYQYCELYNCWRYLQYMGNYIEGATTNELTIHKEVFGHYEDVTSFKVHLTVECNNTLDGTSTSGTVAFNLNRNTPPKDGSCSISPTNGTAARTKFQIQCQGFIDDDDTIVDYSISCLSLGKTWSVVAGGNQQYWSGRTLPAGDPNNNNTLTCKVAVKDDLGSYAEYSINEIQVHPVSALDYMSSLLNSRSSEGDDFDIMEAVANLDDTTSLGAVTASMLETVNKEFENEEMAGKGSALSYASTPLNASPNDTRAGAFTQTVDDPEAVKQFEEMRDAAIKVVDQVLHTLKSCTVESAEDAVRQAETLALLSTSVVNLNREGQNVSTDLLSRGYEKALKFKDSMSFEDTKNVVENSVAACTNVIKSANLGKNFPANSDIQTQASEVPNFDTNLDSSLPDVGSFDNDADALFDGMKILNTADQDKFTGNTLSTCTTLEANLIELLADKSPTSDQPIDMSSDNMAMKLYKSKASQVLNTPIDSGGCKMKLPGDVFSDPDEDVVLVGIVLKSPGTGCNCLKFGIVAFQVKTSASPGAPLDDDAPINSFSRELTIKVNDPTGATKAINNLTTPVRLVIPQDPMKPKMDESALPYAHPKIVGKNEYFFYHAVNVVHERAALQLVFRPTQLSYYRQLLVVVNYLEAPRLGNGEVRANVSCMIPSDTYYKGFYGDDNTPDPYTCFVSSDIIGTNTGMYYIGVRQLATQELNWYKTIEDLPTEIPDYWKSNNDFDFNYKFWPNEITCSYTEDGNTEYKTDGMKPHPLTTEYKLVCETYHFTTFGGAWAVAPNTIDWDFVFSNADFMKNPTLYITEIVILLMYIIAMIWARRQDKKDIEKLGLAPLPCNDIRDKYFYEILVSTGLRRGAGTESKVHFILSGDEEETEVRSFVDKKRKIFTRGSTDGFLLSVPECLGDLLYLRIWHDNSGKGRAASWYLNHVVIRDVQTDRKYIFIANRWLAVDEDDGQVDRVIPIAGKNEMTEFSHLFAARATKNLSDGHLWFSVVARPPQSRFTRCQRVSCCLCLLFTSMLANAMFYGTETSDANAFQFGPFAVSSEQIFIGVVCNIIIFPVNFLLITLFRKSRPRKLRPSRFEVALKTQSDPNTTSISDVNPRVKSAMDRATPGSSFLIDANGSSSTASRPATASSSAVMPTDKKGKKKCDLPWWFTIVAWIILWLTVLVSAAFVTFYGIMFQDIKCKKWITSMLISFFTSVFFTQPIKVFLLAIIFSVIIKNPSENEDEEGDDEETPKALDRDEELLHKENTDEFDFMGSKKASYIPKPPDQSTLQSAREQRLKEKKMWAVIREIIFYAFFLWILMVISYKSVSTNSYDYKYTMEKVFIHTNDTNKAFNKVKNTEDFWKWAKSGMLRGLRAGPYYNNFPPFYMRGYINDKQSRLMGYAVLRQVRTMPNTCKVPYPMDKVIEECNELYNMRNEEGRDFGVGWTPLDVNNSREEYQYMSASELNGYPFWGDSGMYGGGGYVVKLKKGYYDMVQDLEQLHNEQWIDKYTRAIFLEFTVYNPSINLFAISSLLAEFRPSGGVFSSFRFEPCVLLPYMEDGVLFQIICEVFYLVYMSHLDLFKSFIGSCEAGIVMMMGKFDIYNMLEVNQWLTQLFIFLFVVTITFIVVNMLLSILNDTFSAVRNDTSKQQNDYEIVDFMMSRFRVWTGIGKSSTAITPTDETGHTKSIEEQVHEFPDQMDRFLASISNMYADSARFEHFLHDGMTKKLGPRQQNGGPNLNPRAFHSPTLDRELPNVHTD